MSIRLNLFEMTERQTPNFILVVTSQKRIKSTRYQVNAEMDTRDEELTYGDLFVKYPDEGSASIGAAYDAIDEILMEAEVYFQVKTDKDE